MFYHLLDPFYAFSQIRHRCHEHTVVVFEGDAFFELIETPDQSAALYARDVRKAPRFVPDPGTLRLFIDAAYFKIIAESVFPLSEPTSDGMPPRGVNRMLLVCQPFNGLNRCYEYPPPFGLNQYDSRSLLPPDRWSELYIRSEPI